MIVPKLSVTTRYYVAINEDEAYASYASLEEANECIEKFKSYRIDYIDNVSGIIEVSENNKIWLKIIK
jgi:hypothetical protein